MANTLQDFLGIATQKTADELVTAFLRLPEDRRDWSPEDKARTALDLVAECALLNGYTADLIRTRVWADGNFDRYTREKADIIAQGWEPISALLKENTQKMIAAIREVPDDALGIEIAMPWGKQPLTEIMSYSYWNMTYHQGQINYIASMLGCLD
jgi:hypothetical protein